MTKLSKSEIIPFIKIAKKDGDLFFNETKQLFKNKPILNSRYKIIYEKDYVLFPLKNDMKVINEVKKSFEELLKYKIIFKKGAFNKKFKYRSIQDAVENIIPKYYYKFIPRSYDIIGDIAILEFEKNLTKNITDSSNFKETIAKALIQVNNNVKSVFEKISEIKGPFRLRELNLLYGEKKTLTQHKENDCIFKVDIKKTFFSPRLVFERRRIASSEFKKNEIIVDMFAGIGPFSIQIAKLTHANIYTFDLNPDAYNLLLNNIRLNNLENQIIPFNIDVRKLLNHSNELGRSLKHDVDRVIMNLPECSLEFLDVACFLLKKSGGIIHNYQFSEKPNPIKKAIDKLEAKLEENHYYIDHILNSKIVKNFSPKSDLVVVDLQVNKK